MEQAHETADIPCAGYVTSFLSLPCSSKQAANQLIRHVEYSVGEPCLKIDTGRHQDRSPPVCSIATDLVGIRHAPFPDELMKAIFVNVCRNVGREADGTDRAQSVEQFTDVVRLRRDRRVPQPCEWRRSCRRIDGKEAIKFGELLARDAPKQDIRGTLAGAGPASNGSSLDHGRRRKNDLLSAKGSDNAGDNRLTSIGAPSGLRGSLDHEGQIGSTRWPQSKRRSEDARVVCHRLRPTGILGKHRGGELQPYRQPVHEEIDRFIHLRQGHAGMPKQCQLHGKPKTVGGTAPPHHKVLVGSWVKV